MSDRKRELAEREATLRLRCAAQRYLVEREANDVAGRLQSVDRFVVVARRIIKHPLTIVAAIAGVVAAGPMRTLRLVGRGVMMSAAVRRVLKLL